MNNFYTSSSKITFSFLSFSLVAVGRKLEMSASCWAVPQVSPYREWELVLVELGLELKLLLVEPGWELKLLLVEPSREMEPVLVDPALEC